MVEGQIRPNRVTDPALLDALRTLPRETFVPRHLQSLCYADEDIPLGNGRYMQEPMILARLIQEARIGKGDVVLDIGCGTGYSSALMGHLASTVVAIESDPAMAAEADRRLRDLGVVNAAVFHRPSLNEGYRQQAPYDVIVINGSVSAVPEPVKNQLADGGRLVTVLSTRGHMGSAVLITRIGDAFTTRALFDAATPILPGFEAPKGFVF